MNPPASALALRVLAVAALLSGCEGPTQSIVRLELGDGVVEAANASELRVQLCSDGGAERTWRAPLFGLGAVALPAQLPIEPLEGDATTRWALRAELADEDGAVVAFGRAVGGFEEGAQVFQTLRFETACVGVVGCAPFETCEGGVCIALEGSVPCALPESGGPMDLCPVPDANTLALHDFEAGGPDGFPDRVGQHPGAFFGQAPIRYAVTPDAPCGRHLFWPFDTESGATTPDGESPDWDQVRSVDFWVRAGAIDAPLTELLSRLGPRSLEVDGLARLILLGVPGNTGPEGTRLILQVQRALRPGDPAGETRFKHFCSEAGRLDPSRWSHVGLNVGDGGVEIWVDGVRTSSTDMIEASALGTIACLGDDDRPFRFDGQGNVAPWQFGAGPAYDEAGAIDPTNASRPIDNGALDHVRWSAVRRDFSALATPIATFRGPDG